MLLVRRGAILNRIYLGIALYFVSGTIALLTRWPWLNAEYGRLEGTAMLYWVLALGLFFTLFNARGYIGLDADPRTVRIELMVAARDYPDRRRRVDGLHRQPAPVLVPAVHRRVRGARHHQGAAARARQVKA